jgi:hypothetical protein
MQPGGYRWATGEEMKAFLVLVLALVFAGMVATALAFGQGPVSSSLSAVAAHALAGTSEPAAMLLSGSALLGLAGAVKRFTF